MITVTPTLQLDETELQFQFKLASGPGGQNVNKVATAAELRFDAAHSPALPDEVRARLFTLAGNRIEIEVLHGLSRQRRCGSLPGETTVARGEANPSVSHEPSTRGVDESQVM